MKLRTLLALMALTILSFPAPCAVRFVDLNSPDPSAPYADWQTAARTIQEAIDVAVPGDEVVVADGVYATSSRTNSGLTPSRVVVDKAIIVRSLNGPQSTTIQGYQVPGATNVVGAIRCAYLTNGAVLSGFTLTLGSTWNSEAGGGVLCAGPSAMLSNCVLVANRATRGGGVSRGTLENCTLARNLASGAGGGADSATLNRCVVTGNSAGWEGSGAYGGALNSCVLTNNLGRAAAYSQLVSCIVRSNNDGLYSGSAIDCTVTENKGRGLTYTTATNCFISGNMGGAYAGTLYNCVLLANSAGRGGGVEGGTLVNCTIVGNSATNGGGAFDANMTNCICYFNDAPVSPNYSPECEVGYSCTTPQPPRLQGNITMEPLFEHLSAGDLRLQSNSPCIDAGIGSITTHDFEGQPRVSGSRVDMGAYEFQMPGGPFAPYFIVQPVGLSVASGYPAELQARVLGTPALTYQWHHDGVAIPGATNSYFTLPAARIEDAGSYTLLVSNLVGSVQSSAAVLNVVPPSIRYVDANNPNPVPPFTSWATAARTIQDAIDAALAGDEVLVTNGVYATGGRPSHAALTNRVMVDRAVTLRSVNGPEVTLIAGYQVPGATNGPGAVRCVYLTNGASLIGFTMTNGATYTYPYANYYDQRGGGVFCESKSVTVSNCVMVGNSADFYGGGAFSGTLLRCTLRQNVALSGGGASDAVLKQCVLTENQADYDAGGAYWCQLQSCLLTGNRASDGGGGAGMCRMVNCTITRNTAGSGGGVQGGWLTNCIVYFNEAASLPNVSPSGIYPNRDVITYTCTTPEIEGVGNISSDPGLAGVVRLSSGSPCRGAGMIVENTAPDIDGEPWAIPPSMGCDEFSAGTATGPLEVRIVAADTNSTPNHPVSLSGHVEGKASHSVWNFGDGTSATNRPSIEYSWAAPGTYEVVFTAFNQDHPDGVNATVTIQVVAGTHYVNQRCENPQPPYTTWETAATNIQDAVDVATAPGSVVWVGAGSYQHGGKTLSGAILNRVAIERPILVISVTGPSATYINGLGYGSGMSRCAYVGSGGALSGFTLSNGFADAGGGVLGGGAVTNCWIQGNTAILRGGGVSGGAYFSCVINQNRVIEPIREAFDGGAGANVCSLYNCTLANNYGGHGGASWVTLINCVVTGNSEGGAFASDLYNCTVVGNGEVGVGECLVYNSIVYYNGPGGVVNHISCPMNYCCTTPARVLEGGVGIITNEPLFILGDYTLSPNSPCINRGGDHYVSVNQDYNGNRRIVGGTVDIGALEFFSAKDEQFFAWLEQNDLPNDGSADYTDSDADRLNNWQEWICGTDPLDPASALRMFAPQVTPSAVRLTWQSVSDRTYVLERATEAAGGSFLPISSAVLGSHGTSWWNDTNMVDLGTVSYRVRVLQ